MYMYGRSFSGDFQYNHEFNTQIIKSLTPCPKSDSIPLWRKTKLVTWALNRIFTLDPKT